MPDQDCQNCSKFEVCVFDKPSVVSKGQIMKELFAIASKNAPSCFQSKCMSFAI